MYIIINININRPEAGQIDFICPAFFFGKMDFYKTTRWKKLREKILRRDGYMCQISKRYGRSVKADTVHHIFPRERYPELAWEPWNLISLSAAAHDKLHDRDTHELTKEGKALQERTRRKYGGRYRIPPP